jgi:murein DD-endopeptidase MepM/ murein hydrolase activator NlpD
MKEGSVTVVTGEQVGRGDVLGQVGMSGRTQFPHVHISVRHSGAVVDPFAPDGDRDCGVDVENTFGISNWTRPLAD